MELYNRFIKLKNISLALGFFDGVHLGHQAVIRSAVKNAVNTKSAVITFKSSPAELFGSKCKYISTLEERRKHIEKLGVDYLFEIDFSKELSNLTAYEYIDMIIKYFSPKFITTGFNHTFGKNKLGTPELLEHLQEKFNYKYSKILPESFNGTVISSTLIKEYLTKGELTLANNMLGYEFQIAGTVVHGNHLGNKIGFPTANILYPKEKVQIPFGVYKTKVNGYDAMTNFGIKPTVTNTERPLVESHIFNFNNDIYNTNIEIQFIKKIRDEKKFNSLNELVEQINKDKAECSK